MERADLLISESRDGHPVHKATKSKLFRKRRSRYYTAVVLRQLVFATYYIRGGVMGFSKFKIIIAAIIGSTTIALADTSLAQSGAYDWLTVGEPSGEMIVEAADDGSLSLTFSFNDRGRGPELEAQYRLDENGVPVFIQVNGLNYTKGNVDERFSIENGHARWDADGVSGEQSLSTPSLYNSGAAATIPLHAAILARALLNDDDQKMPTLPFGELSLRTIETVAFSGPNGVVNATLYALQSNTPYPTYVWLDENHNLFGTDYGWFAIAPKGMAHTMPIMKEKQDNATDARTAELTNTLRHDADGLVVIKNARLFDSLSGDVIRNTTVFIHDGIISAVYHDDVDTPEGAKEIDADGKMLMPALWDMHAHIGTNNVFNYLSAGVVNIRDMANDPDYLLRIRRIIDDGTIAGPDLHLMGFIDQRSEYSAPTGNLAETLEDALKFVDWYAQRGFRGIKLYSSINPDWVAPIAEHAHARGMTVLGHIPSSMTAEQAIRAGYDEITHINMLFLNFMNAEEIDTRTPQRFIVPIREGGNLDLDSDEVAAFITLMKDRNIAHDPTYTIFRSMFVSVPGDVSLEAKRYYENLPEAARQGMIEKEGFNKGLEAEGRETAEVARALIRTLHENGIRLLPGTDAAYPGFVLLRELELYADAGIPENEVLQLATIESARHMGLDQSLGSITPSKRAHLILVDGDPTRRITDLLKVDLVIKDTAIYKPAEIHEIFGIAPFE